MADGARAGVPAGAAEPGDNAPTIISRVVPRPARAEDVFMNTLRGQRLAHFELLEPIGVGGMAAVIRARDTLLDRIVALKVLPPEMAADAENISRFQNEARAAAKLDHENVARVFFCGEDQGLHFIAFEFVEGDNLSALLDRRGPLPVAEAVGYMLQAARGVAHASARGVVHRDIKPSNIIVSPNGKAKLVDMGLARSLERHADHALTQSGVTLGSYDYISPEQALEPREADVRSDIYSLGCTFYHVLTGRAPVPDGTAAKKLHHHHQVAPPDPRGLNPEIPASLAAVLARMMAKDPAKRYQRAEELVHDLAEVAGELGPIAEVRATPARPISSRHRRGLAMVAAALALVLLPGLYATFWWRPSRSLSEPTMEPMAGALAPANASAVSENPASGAPGRESVTAAKPIVHEAFRREAGSAAELTECLAEFARQRPAVGNIFLTGDIDLTTLPTMPDSDRSSGLVIDAEGSKLVLAAREGLGGKRPTIRFGFEGDPAAGATDVIPVRAALMVRGGTVVLRGLRFEMNAALAQIVLSGVKLQEAGQLMVENCEFVQTDPPDPSQGQISSIAVEDGGAGTPKLVEIRNCYFGVQETGAGGAAAAAGQSAVAVTGPATVKVTDCAFAPHAALFRLRSGPRHEKIDLSVHNCSAFLVDGSAFQVNEGVFCRLDVQQCVFSRPTSAVIAGAGATLIQQKGEARDIRYEGYDNRYHNLSAFWLKTPSPMAAATVYAATWDQFQKAVWPDGTDRESRALSVSPWADKKDPLRWLRQEPQEPGRAFQVDPRLAEMRQVDHKDTRLVGVEYCTWGIIYDGDLPPIEEARAELPGDRIVDPKVARSGDGIYPTLNQAIGEARPGDVIFIRHNGLLRVEPIRLEKPTVNLTIKPFPDCHPILTLGETAEADAALFRLHDGTLRLEQVEFYLRPARDEFTSQAVVDLVGYGQCTLKDCVVTLEEPRHARLVLAALTEPSHLMRIDPQAPHAPAPSVHLERCFIRGEGDLTAVRGARPLDLDVQDSVVALEGSFLKVDGAGHDAGAPSPVQVRLSRVTTFLTENLVRLVTNDPRVQVPVWIRPVQDCLFASAGGKPLVQLDGPAPDEARMKNLFHWEGRQNAYSRFMPMLDRKSRGEPVATVIGPERWRVFTGETDGLFAPVQFTEPPRETVLARAVPSNFKVKWESEQQAYGAAVDQLPPPRVESSAGLAP